MNIEVVKKLIKNIEAKHKLFIQESETAERYYANENDILRLPKDYKETEPLRHADNRIPRNYHSLLVNQKAAYMFTAPPLFDTGDTGANKEIADVLGDSYAKTCKDLCVNAANSRVAWIHYWTNKENKFEYAVMDSKQIIAVFSLSIDNKLIAVLRNYKDFDIKDGKEIVIWEYWTEEKCYSFKKKKGSIYNIEPYCVYESLDEDEEEFTNEYIHGFDEVPFIPFYNNNIHTNDLKNIKPLIDAYDKVFSGFLNDLEDIQSVIFVLTNYGGENLEDFLKNLKKYKTIKVENEEGTGKSGVDTISIDIPIEARKEFLEITRKAIFEQGQGVDPNPEKFGNKSGEALKFLYSLLELKSGFTETEFRPGFGKLIRAICKHLKKECKQIMQTWTRTAITSDKETAEIASSSTGVISQKSILKYHPWVDNVDDEIVQVEKEATEKAKRNAKQFSYHQEE